MEIKPFKAYRYNKEKVGDVGNCISPPYDVINKEQQEELYNRSEYNIVRIIRGKSNESDNDCNNVYTRAADYLNEWIKEDVLKRDAKESIYGYVQDFAIGGVDYQRYSFVALGKLEEFGEIVRPHEQILKGPIVDRMNLKRATSARFGLVFMIYEDKKNVAEKVIAKNLEGGSLVDFVDEMGVRHRLFSLSDELEISAIGEMMKDKSCIIADGHHRYTTGLTLAKENTNPVAKYQMSAFCNSSHEGLIVLATHRAVKNLEGFEREGFLTKLGSDFKVTKFEFSDSESKREAEEKLFSRMKKEYSNNHNAFGIYGGKDCFYLAVLIESSAMDEPSPEKSKAWRSLDVAVLQKLILEKVLGIDEDKLAEGKYVEYIKDTYDAVERLIGEVDAGKKQVVFFMNPPKVSQIEEVADAGERMPQKSTYFYPKVFTGLTINKL